MQHRIPWTTVEFFDATRGADVSDDRETPSRADDTPPLPGSTPAQGEPDQGDNQDVPARKIYPTDPTGAEPA